MQPIQKVEQKEATLSRKKKKVEQKEATIKKLSKLSRKLIKTELTPFRGTAAAESSSRLENDNRGEEALTELH